MLTSTTTRKKVTPAWKVAEPGFYAEYQERNKIQTPTGKIIKFDARPSGNWWGPFHCKECADICANFGKTEKQAFDFNHGSDDEKFCTFLVA
jgi:hypothetical protein